MFKSLSRLAARLKSHGASEREYVAGYKAGADAMYEHLRLIGRLDKAGV